jgi:hypothetical protein
MKVVFLGERDAVSGSLGMDALYVKPKTGAAGGTSIVSDWIELWDYTGGISFRGFVTTEREKTLFAFFDASIDGRDLKPG